MQPRNFSPAVHAAHGFSPETMPEHKKHEEDGADMHKEGAGGDGQHHHELHGHDDGTYHSVHTHPDGHKEHMQHHSFAHAASHMAKSFEQPEHEGQDHAEPDGDEMANGGGASNPLEGMYE